MVMKSPTTHLAAANRSDWRTASSPGLVAWLCYAFNNVSSLDRSLSLYFRLEAIISQLFHVCSRANDARSMPAASVAKHTHTVYAVWVSLALEPLTLTHAAVGIRGGIETTAF